MLSLFRCINLHQSRDERNYSEKAEESTGHHHDGNPDCRRYAGRERRQRQCQHRCRHEPGLPVHGWAHLVRGTRDQPNRQRMAVLGSCIRRAQHGRRHLGILRKRPRLQRRLQHDQQRVRLVLRLDVLQDLNQVSKLVHFLYKSIAGTLNLKIFSRYY